MEIQAEKNKIIIGCLCAVLCETFFGLSYVFTKQVTESISTLTLLGWRFMIAFLMMNLCLMTKVITVNLTGKRLLPLFSIAIFQPVIYFSGETLGISLTTASESGSLIACIPITTLIASALILKRKPTRWQIIGVCVTMVGVIACVTAKGIEASFHSLGYAMLFIAVISYSLYSVIAEKAIEFTSIEKTYVMIACGAIVFTIAALIQNTLSGTVMEFITLPFRDTYFLLAVSYLGIGCSVLAFYLYNLAITYVGTNRSASFVGISTVVSILAGTIILEERFSILQSIGTVFVIGGVYLANALRKADPA